MTTDSLSALAALESEYGIDVPPAVVDILYGSDDRFVASVDSGQTRLFENGRAVDMLPSSAALVRFIASGKDVER